MSFERFVIINNEFFGLLFLFFKNLCSFCEFDIKYNVIFNIDVIFQLFKLEIFLVICNNIFQFSGMFEWVRSIKLNWNFIIKFEIKVLVFIFKVFNLFNVQFVSIDELFYNMFNLEWLEFDKNYFVLLFVYIGNF